MRIKSAALGITLGLVIFWQAANAAPVSGSPAHEDISGLFCEKINDVNLYNQYKYDPYKMLIQGTDGWIFRSESDFKTDFMLPRHALDKLEELNKAYKMHGVDLVMLLVPTRTMVHHQYIREEDKKKYGMTDIASVWKNYWESINAIKKRGIHVVGIQKPGAGESFFYKRDHHWNPDGAKKAAQAVAEEVKNLPSYGAIEKTGFLTRDLGSYEFFGVSKKVFKKICGTDQPPERIIKTATDRVDESSGQDDLFGETKIPGVVLLGTSNSTMEPSFSNFEGFLKEALSADILNMSVSGGGLDTAMISYLNSDYFHDHPARIAIWEIPGYYDIENHENFFREAIPAAYGSCGSAAVARVDNLNLSDKTVVAIDRLAAKKIRGEEYYAEIEFTSPMTRSFHIDFRYEGGRDKYKFQRSGRGASSARFFAGLKEDKGEYLNRVILAIPQEEIGRTASVSICKKDLKMASIAPGKELHSPSSVKVLLKKMINLQ